MPQAFCLCSTIYYTAYVLQHMVIQHVNGLYKGLNSSLQCAVVLMLAQRHSLNIRTGGNDAACLQTHKEPASLKLQRSFLQLYNTRMQGV